MSSAIHEMPTEKDWGLGFNYNNWTQGTTITLANVPWNSDYRDIVRFDSQAHLDDYLNTKAGPTIDITRASYAKFGRPIRIDTPFHTVQNYNYVRVYNPAQPITGDVGRVFYYFVVDVEYVSAHTTHLYIQLDVWQTFGYGVSFGNCYIQQGHIGIANERAMENYGRDYLTIPEGLDFGNEYEISAQYSHAIAGARDSEPNFEILVASTTALNKDAGDVNAPQMHSAEGSVMENLPNGAELYLFNSAEHFKEFMGAMADKPWVTQGIVSVTAVPPMGRYGISTTSRAIEGVSVAEVNGGELTRPQTNLRDDWRNDIELGRYERLTKFKTYPYTVVEMTTYSGMPLVLKPECMQWPNMVVIELPHFAPPNPRLAFYPYRYNAGAAPHTVDDKGIINDGAEFMDVMTGIMDFPMFSVVNNGYMQFMAANQAGIAFQHSSADWSQNKVNQAANTGYDQATAGINTSKDMAGQGIGAANAQSMLARQTMGSQAMQAGANAFVNGFKSLDPIGAAQGFANAAVGFAISDNQAMQSNTISTGLSQGLNDSATANMAYMRDTNNDLAKWTANGDYQNTIAGIAARVQDAKMTQPTTAGQLGGNAFNLAVYRWSLDIKVKTLPPAYMAAIGEYWFRYGYAINRFGRMPASFMVMEKFTYWKLKETYITSSSCPESFKQVIRGIFEKGVTVWKNPKDIGNIDIADNAPLPGVRL